jgi:hypothetical protein
MCLVGQVEMYTLMLYVCASKDPKVKDNNGTLIGQLGFVTACLLVNERIEGNASFVTFLV